MKSLLTRQPPRDKMQRETRVPIRVIDKTLIPKQVCPTGMVDGALSWLSRIPTERDFDRRKGQYSSSRSPPRRYKKRDLVNENRTAKEKKEKTTK